MAASNLEKAIFDCAKSNISYKAAIVNRRKEIMKSTENFQIHSSFLADQSVKAKKEVCPVAAGMFQKASDMLETENIEKKEAEAETKKVPKFMSTSDRLKRLKKPKEKKPNLNKAEQDLMLKYLKPKVKTEPEVSVDPKPEVSVEPTPEVKEDFDAEVLSERNKISKPEADIKPDVDLKPEVGSKPGNGSDLKLDTHQKDDYSEPDSQELAIDENFKTKMPTFDQVKTAKPAQKGRLPLFQQKLAAQKTDRLARLKRLNQLTGENSVSKKRKIDENEESDSKKIKVDAVSYTHLTLPTKA